VLDLSIHVWVGDRILVHPDVVVIIEIQALLLGELGAVVCDDEVGGPKAENNVLYDTYHLLGVNFRQGPCLDPLSEFVDRDE
jgi:hypothetical protein